MVGVNTAILSPTGGSIGIGFSMASNVVTKVVAQLKEFGETRRGWLGVRIQDVTPDVAEAMNLAVAEGALITDVPDGPAKDAGLLAGDVITTFNGKPIADVRDLTRTVADSPIGEAVPVVVQREGSEMTIDVTLGRREVAEGEAVAEGGSDAAPEAPVQSELLGMTLKPLDAAAAEELGLPSGSEGLAVVKVDAASEAAAKGLSRGDIIVEAGQRPVASLKDLSDRIEEAKAGGRKSLLLLVRRDGDPRFVALSVE